MEFFQLINDRRSMRKFSTKPVEIDKINTIYEAINRAPSAGNLQSYEVYIVRSEEMRKQLVKAAHDQQFLAEAPLVIVFCTHPGRAVERYAQRGTSLYCIQDATIACTFAMLAAKALGLDSVWVGAFNEEQVSSILQIPEEQRPIAMLPIGYAGKEPLARPRRAISELIHDLG
jgi:nitroreductase